jgi:hypothetical protein
MPTPLDKEQRMGMFRQFLSGLSFPKLFLLLCGLFVIDLFLPDPILLVDEAILGILAVMFGMWRNRKGDKLRDSPGLPPSRET